MKSFCDLSYLEKCHIKEGNVNKYNYLVGYDYRVKSAVKEGVDKKKKNDE